MIKPKELRKKSDKELNKMLKTLEMDLMKEKSLFGKGTPEEKSLRKSAASPGMRTSIQRDIRRLIAKIKTIQNERRRDLSPH